MTKKQKKRSKAIEVKVGGIYRSQWWETGMFKVLKIEQGEDPEESAVVVEFIEDHPKGYKTGSHGRYMVSDLRKVSVAGK
jgi:hypothetical protein